MNILVRYVPTSHQDSHKLMVRIEVVRNDITLVPHVNMPNKWIIIMMLSIIYSPNAYVIMMIIIFILFEREFNQNFILKLLRRMWHKCHKVNPVIKVTSK